MADYRFEGCSRNDATHYRGREHSSTPWSSRPGAHPGVTVRTEVVVTIVDEMHQLGQEEERSIVGTTHFVHPTSSAKAPYQGDKGRECLCSLSSQGTSGERGQKRWQRVIRFGRLKIDKKSAISLDLAGPFFATAFSRPGF
jgi:hypothetical protein